MRSFRIVGDVGIVIVRDCTRERQIAPAEHRCISISRTPFRRDVDQSDEFSGSFLLSLHTLTRIREKGHWSSNKHKEITLIGDPESTHPGS